MNRCLTSSILILTMIQAPQQSERASLGGVVRNTETGQPVAEVTVQVVGGAAVRTDSDGKFRIENIVPGVLSVQFSKEGFQTAVYPPTVSPGQRLETNQQLKPLKVITGRIVDNMARALVGGSVRAYRYEYREGQLQLLGAGRVDTDDRGQYRLALDPGNYIIRVFPPTGSTLGSYLFPGVSELAQAVPVEIKANGEPQAIPLEQIALAPAQYGWIRVHIVNETGEPILPITAIARSLTLRDWGNSFVAGQSVISAREPLATAPNFDLLQYRPDVLGAYDIVEGWDHGNVSMRGGAQVEFKGFDTDVNVVVRKPTLPLSVKISWEERTAAGSAPLTNVGLTLRSSNGIVLNAQTGEGGRISKLLYPGKYTIENIANIGNERPGNGVFVSSARQGERDVLKDGFDVSDSEVSIDIVLGRATGVISGVVSDLGGTPVNGAGLGLIPDPPSSNAVNNHALFRSAKSGRDGSFKFDGVVPGAYRLYVWAHCPDCAPGENSSQAIMTGKYKNAEFMKQYESHGIAVSIEDGGRVTLQIHPLDSL